MDGMLYYDTAINFTREIEVGHKITLTGKIPDADKRVCRTDVTTGSIIPKRTCRTKGEWEAIRARSIAAAERMKSEQDRRRHTQESVENQ